MNKTIFQGSVGTASSITALGIILARALQYAASIIFVAYLTPEVIGEYAFAMFLMMSVFSLLTTGTDSRIIAMELSNAHLKESWTIEVIRGVLILIIILSICSYALFNMTFNSMHGYLLILGFSMLIRCSKNINIVIARKNLNMTPIFYIELGSALAFFITSILLLFLLENGWALPLGYLAGSIVYTGLSFVLLPIINITFKFDFQRFREIFSYSKWLNLSAQIVSFFENIVPLIISSLFGIANLGLFEKSDQFSRKIIAQITQVFWIVGLPWSSQEHKNKRDSYEIISVILLFFIILAIPLLIAISILIPEFLVYVGGASWSGSQGLIFALCLVSAIACFNVPFGILMQAIKLPNLSLYAGLVKLLTFIIGLFVFNTSDIISFINLLALSNFISLVYYLIICFKRIDKRISYILRDILLFSVPYTLFYIFGYEMIEGKGLEQKFIFISLFFFINLFYCLCVSSINRNIYSDFIFYLNKLKNNT